VGWGSRVSGGGGGYVVGVGSVHFRAGVVIVVRHPDKQRVLAFERNDTPGSWQLPQGGLKNGEDPETGAWRELLEETGLGPDDVRIDSEHPDWLVYEWPPELQRSKSGPYNRIGQVQRWFVFYALDSAIEPTPDGKEFRDWQWVEPAWLIDHVPDWRRGPYERVLSSL